VAGAVAQQLRARSGEKVVGDEARRPHAGELGELLIERHALEEIVDAASIGRRNRDSRPSRGRYLSRPEASGHEIHRRAQRRAIAPTLGGVGDQVRRVLGREHVRVDHEVVVRRLLLGDAVEAAEVVAAVAVEVRLVPRGALIARLDRLRLDSRPLLLVQMARRRDQHAEDVRAQRQRHRRGMRDDHHLALLCELLDRILDEQA
jgi:hypothetical protein